MKDIRKHMRLPIKMKVEIKSKEKGLITAITKNISFGGMGIDFNCNHKFSTGDECDIILILQESDEPIIVNFTAKVIHESESFIGVQFLSIEAEGYDHFYNLMLANSKDPDKLISELKVHPGLVM